MTDDHKVETRDQNSPLAQLLLLTDEEAKRRCALVGSDTYLVQCCDQKGVRTGHLTSSSASFL